jgi:hypothetical protein
MSSVSGGTVPQVKTLPVDVEVVKRTPVVREFIRPHEFHEVKPVIYRERENLEVRQIEQPIYETVRHAPVVRECALPAENRPVIQPNLVSFEQAYNEELTKYKSGVEYAPIERETVTRPPVVIETIRKRVKEEIQPVIYREILQEEIVRETQPIYEKIFEAPTFVKVQNKPIYEKGNFIQPVMGQTTLQSGMSQPVMGQTTLQPGMSQSVMGQTTTQSGLSSTGFQQGFQPGYQPGFQQGFQSGFQPGLASSQPRRRSS